MIAFWIVAGCFVLAALLFVLPPLLARGDRSHHPERNAVNLSIYQDELRELDSDLANGTVTDEQYQASRIELKRRMLEDVQSGGEAAAAPARGRWMGAVAGVAIPVLAVLLYLQLGTPDGLDPAKTAAGDPHAGGQITPEQIAAMVDGLAERLEKNPDDAEGWVMLARSYTAMGRFSDASVAFQKATALVPNDAQLLADYADVLAMTQGKKLQGRPEEMIRQALAIDPGNPKALALAGTVAFQAKNYPKAVEHWEKLLSVTPPESPMANSVRGAIAEARGLAGGGAGAPPRTAQPAAGGGAKVAGTVALSPDLAAKASPEDVVFVFARAAQGPRMPLAIMRLKVKDLPAEFTLDDSMAMAPGMNLSSFPDVVVGARVSRTGNATPSSGDLEGMTPAKVGANGVQVVISQVLP